MSSPRADVSAPSRDLVEAWRADRASTDEVRRAYARFVERQRPRRRPLRFVYWVVVGSVLGVGLAQAATHAPWQAFGFGTRVVQPQRVAQRARAVSSPGPPSAVASSVEPVAEAKAEAAPAPAAAAPSTGLASSSVVAKAAQIQEQWQRVSSALRANDFATANRGLLEIERSAPGGEGDAAKLARAQLLLSHGRAAEATGLLTSLSQRAQSELVRRKASEMLGQLNALHRSTGRLEDTQQP